MNSATMFYLAVLVAITALVAIAQAAVPYAITLGIAAAGLYAGSRKLEAFERELEKLP